MSFHDPSRWGLLLLLFLPVIVWAWRSRHYRTTLRFSSLNGFVTARSGFAARLRWLLPTLRILAVGLLVVCVARPQKGDEQTRVLAEGIAIQWVVDLSGSIEALDFKLDGKNVNRLEAIKKVSREFVEGNGKDLVGRPDDLLGLIVFGTFADSLAPLTLDHDMVLRLLDESQSYNSIERQRELMELQEEFGRVQRSNPSRARQIEADFNRLREESGTAIGDAVALGVERLRGFKVASKDGSTGNTVKGKIIILLTDGAQTAGDLSPEAAAKLASELGIRVYTIGVGTAGPFRIPVLDRNGRVQLVEPDDYRGFRIDEPVLKEMAQTTGGRYYHATDTESLRNIYAEIDQIEKTQTEEKRYKQYKELATQSTTWGGVTLPPLLLGVVGLLVLEIVLSNTVLRKIP